MSARRTLSYLLVSTLLCAATIAQAQAGSGKNTAPSTTTPRSGSPEASPRRPVISPSRCFWDALSARIPMRHLVTGALPPPTMVEASGLKRATNRHEQILRCDSDTGEGLIESAPGCGSRGMVQLD